MQATAPWSMNYQSADLQLSQQEMQSCEIDSGTPGTSTTRNKFLRSLSFSTVRIGMEIAQRGNPIPLIISYGHMGVCWLSINQYPEFVLQKL